jgi:hypothetical protein
MIGSPPTSHCTANAVLNAEGCKSVTKERTTTSPIACMAAMKKAIPPSRMPRRRRGAIFRKKSDNSNASENSESYF